MNITAPTATQPGAPPLERLARQTSLTERQKLTEACRHFEALLARQILAEAYRPVSLAGESSQTVPSAIYQDMIINQLSDSISRSGGFGIRHALFQQLARPSDSDRPVEPLNPLPEVSHPALKKPAAPRPQGVSTALDP